MIAVAADQPSSQEASLDLLASQLIRLSQQRGLTPVIVTPPYLALRQRFFVELVGAIRARTARPIRIDWCRPVPSVLSLFGDSLAGWRVASTNRALATIGPSVEGKAATMQITATIGRPGGLQRDLVIGWCTNTQPLPAWTTAIELSN